MLVVSAEDSEVGDDAVVGSSVVDVVVVVGTSDVVVVGTSEVGSVVESEVVVVGVSTEVEVEVCSSVVVLSLSLSLVGAVELDSTDVAVVVIVSFPDCLFASWTMDVANSGSLAWIASMAEWSES